MENWEVRDALGFGTTNVVGYLRFGWPVIVSSHNGPDHCRPQCMISQLITIATRAVSDYVEFIMCRLPRNSFPFIITKLIVTNRVEYWDLSNYVKEINFLSV